MTIVRQPGYSQLVVGHIIPEILQDLYHSIEQRVADRLEEIFTLHAERNETTPGALYFYFQGKFYSSKRIRVHNYHAIRPTFVLHHSLVEVMTKLLEVMESESLVTERTEVTTGLRTICRKACNVDVLKRVIDSSLHPPTLLSFSDSRILSDQEADLAYNLRDNYQDILIKMKTRKALNLFLSY